MIEASDHCQSLGMVIDVENGTWDYEERDELFLLQHVHPSIEIGLLESMDLHVPYIGTDL